jgi:hypothetical protein
MEPHPDRTTHPAACPQPVADILAAAVAELEVHGQWSHHLGTDIIRRLRERLAARPAAVIIDLHALLDPEAASLPLWLAARRATGVLKPSVRLALCLPSATVLDSRLRRLGAHRLPTFATMPEARAAISDRLRRHPPATT